MSTSQFLERGTQSQYQTILANQKTYTFEEKRKFLYGIFIELHKLTGKQGILQDKNLTTNSKSSCFINVDQFFQQILLSTFQQYVVDTIIELSNKIKNQPSITNEDKQEFIKGLKCLNKQQTIKDNLCIKKKKKAEQKLLGLQETQVQNQDIISKSIEKILDNLTKIFIEQ